GANELQIVGFEDARQHRAPHAARGAENGYLQQLRYAPIRSKNSLTPSNHERARGLCRSPPFWMAASKARSFSFCSAVRLTGVSTCMRQNRSPTPLSRTERTPLPRRRNRLPDCVSGGTLSTTLPSSVGTSTVPPSAAVAKLTGTSQLKF